VTVCGVSGALSLKMMDPLTAPSAAGVNVTLYVQVEPGCSGKLQFAGETWKAGFEIV
jgi:hypothetical protein